MITILDSYTYEGQLKPDHESACVVTCSECGTITETWAFLLPSGAVGAECESCDIVWYGPVPTELHNDSQIAVAA